MKSCGQLLMCHLHSELVLRPLGQRGGEVVEELTLYSCTESFISLYIVGEAKIGEKKEDGGRDACRKENKSINCFKVGGVNHLFAM